MKDDVGPLPARVPAKRRAVEGLADLHIAQWLGSDTLTPSERRRLAAERARRRALAPDVPIGLLVGSEGVTPAQLRGLQRLLRAMRPTEIHHPRTAGRLHQACRALEVPVHVHDRDALEQVLRQSLIVLAAPREMSQTITGTSSVWRMIRRAKHRSIAVHIVLPDGRITGQDGTR